MKKSNIAIMAAVAVVIIAIIAAMFIWNGNSGNDDGKVKVTGIDIAQSSLTIQEGNSANIEYTISPSNATNKTVVWTTSNDKVATVTNGKVTGISAGTAKITAKTSDGGFTDSIDVTVTASQVAVIGVILDKTSIAIEAGSTSTIVATVQPSNAANKAVTWATSNSAVATVADGVVTGVAAGTATITAITVDGGKTATCNVTVSKAVSPGYAPTNYVNDFLAKYDGSFGDFEVKETGDDYVALATKGNLKTRIDGYDPNAFRESNILVYGYSSEDAAKAAFNEFLANSKNGSKGETALSQTDKVGMASNFATVKDYRASGASAFGADAAYYLYGSYYKPGEGGYGYTQCIGAIQDGDKVIVFNETKDCDLYYSLPIQDSSYAGTDCVSQAQYEQILMDFSKAFCDPTYVPVVSAPVAYVNNFLSKYDCFFGDLRITGTEGNCVTLATDGNLRTRISDAAEPDRTREATLYVYGYGSDADAKAAFSEFLANSKNGSKGETALSQTDKVGMASSFVTVKDYRASGASAFGADAAYFLYGSYYKAANNGYVQCIGAIQDGDKVVVFNRTIDNDLYCNLPIQDSSYAGTDCISQATYEDELMKFAKAFCDPSYVPAVSVPVAYVNDFLSKYDGFFGDLKVTDVTDNCVTLATDGNLRTRISGAADPEKTREATLYVYGYGSEDAAKAAFNEFLANSKNGSKGETALSQTDKIGMADKFATVKDYRASGASAFGADAAYFLYGSYYKATNNGYVQCIGAIQDGNKVVVFNRTIDNDLYCNLPIQDSAYVGNDCISQAYYEDELMKFARAFCDPTFTPEIASFDDAILKVYGNADGNMVIDRYDINVIKSYIGKAANDSNKMADANNDGKIDAEDVAVVQKIIAREPTHIWHANFHDKDDNGTMDVVIVETQFPVDSILMTGSSNAFMLMWMLGITEEIKGASYSATSVDKYFKYYLDTTKVEKVGTSSTTIPFENGAVGSSNIIAEKGVTTLITDWNRTYITNWQDYENAGIDVVRISAAAVEMDLFAHSALLVGLLMDRADRAVDLVMFYSGAYDQINAKLAGLSEADKVPFIASSMTGYISVGDSDYNNVGRLAGGVYALESMDTGTTTSIKLVDYPQVLNTTLYNFDRILHLRTGNFYDGTEDFDKKWSDYTAPFADWVNGTDGQFIICGGMPVPLRVAYAAEILHPDIVPAGFADALHQQLVDKFFNGDKLDISSMTFVIHK